VDDLRRLGFRHSYRLRPARETRHPSCLGTEEESGTNGSRLEWTVCQSPPGQASQKKLISRVGRVAEVPFRACNRSRHGRPPASAEEHAEPRSAASSVGAADRARWGAERRARTTAVATLAAAQNGTSGGLGHAATRSGTHLPWCHVSERRSTRSCPGQPSRSNDSVGVNPADW
jgi:hypothetical protein